MQCTVSCMLFHCTLDAMYCPLESTFACEIDCVVPPEPYSAHCCYNPPYTLLLH